RARSPAVPVLLDSPRHALSPQRFEGGRQQGLFFRTHGILLVVVRARPARTLRTSGRTPIVRGCGRSRAPSALTSSERPAHPGPPPPGAYLGWYPWDPQTVSGPVP